MVGLWTVVGLCCIDGEFRNKLKRACRNPNPRKLYKFFRKKTNFQLSRFEVEDLRRLIELPKVAKGMETIETEGWHPACPEALSADDDFDLRNFNMKPFADDEN